MSDRSLRLDPSIPVGIGTERKDTIIDRWGTFDKVEGSIIALGLGELHQPQNECPMLTSEMLNEVDSNRYADNQQWVSSWLNFANELLARVDAQLLEYENMLTVLTAETKKTYRDMVLEAGSKKLTVDELNQRLIMSPEYQNVKYSIQQLSQKRLLLKARVETLDSGARLLSRRIELTKIDINAQRGAGSGNDRFKGSRT